MDQAAVDKVKAAGANAAKEWSTVMDEQEHALASAYAAFEVSHDAAALTRAVAESKDASKAASDRIIDRFFEEAERDAQSEDAETQAAIVRQADAFMLPLQELDGKLTAILAHIADGGKSGKQHLQAAFTAARFRLAASHGASQPAKPD